MAYDYVRSYYGVDPVPGHRIRHHVGKKEGTIRREGRSNRHYVRVQFDGEEFAKYCHPTEMDYLGAPSAEVL